MIAQQLTRQHRLGRLYNSYLIQTDRPDQALQQIKDFLKQEIFQDVIDIDNFADLFLVKKIDDKVKNITTDQIRELQNFLYKTSILSGKKIAIIYGAEQMNLNATNSCLKILEDTPENSHLFLISNNSSAILPTISSRCAKISSNYDKNTATEIIDTKYITPLLKKTPLDERLKFIAEFANKNRDLWLEFSNATKELINKFCKKVIDDNYYHNLN